MIWPDESLKTDITAPRGKTLIASAVPLGPATNCKEWTDANMTNWTGRGLDNPRISSGLQTLPGFFDRSLSGMHDLHLGLVVRLLSPGLQSTVDTI